jgi:hypothetical protein
VQQSHSPDHVLHHVAKVLKPAKKAFGPNVQADTALAIPNQRSVTAKIMIVMDLSIMNPVQLNR